MQQLSMTGNLIRHLEDHVAFASTTRGHVLSALRLARWLLVGLFLLSLSSASRADLLNLQLAQPDIFADCIQNLGTGTNYDFEGWAEDLNGSNAGQDTTDFPNLFSLHGTIDSSGAHDFTLSTDFNGQTFYSKDLVAYGSGTNLMEFLFKQQTPPLPGVPIVKPGTSIGIELHFPLSGNAYADTAVAVPLPKTFTAGLALLCALALFSGVRAWGQKAWANGTELT